MKKGFLIMMISILFSVNVLAQNRHIAQELPEKTIIIGKHAIVIDALNQELLDIALASAQQSKQNKIYFKSDINKGVWYDITGRTNISEISVTEDNIVRNSLIDSLELTHYTKITGETIDLSTGKTISLSSVLDLSNPNNMTELEEIKNERDIQQRLKDNVSDNKIYQTKIDSISKVLATIQHSDIEKCEKQLLAIEKFMAYAEKQPNTAPEILKVVLEQKKIISNKKDAYCYQAVLNTIAQENKKLVTNDYSDLLQKYATAQTNIRASLSKLGVLTKEEQPGLAADEPIKKTDLENTTAANLLQGKYIQQMLECINNNQNPQAYDRLLKAFAIETVKRADNNLSSNMKALQKDMLKEVKAEAKNKFNELLALKEGEKYQEAKKYGEQPSVLNKLQKDTIANFNSTMNEIENLDSSIMNKADTDFDKAQALEDTKSFYQSKLASLPKSDISEALQKNMIQIVEDINIQIADIKLNAIADYKNTKKQVEALKSEVSVLNEKYLGAVEQKDKDNSLVYKQQLNEADHKLLEAQNKLEQIEADFKDGKINVDLSKPAGTEDSKSQDSEEQKGQGQTQGQSQDQGQEQDKDSGADTLAQELSQQMDNLSQTVAKLATAQSNQYDNSEKQSIYDQIETLKNKNLEYEFIAPWYIIFKDYQVKLTQPLMKSGEDIYVPAEELAIQIGAQVIKSEAGGIDVIKDNGVLIEYKLGDQAIYINDRKMSIKPEPTQLFLGKVYIPLECFEKAYYLERTQQHNFIILSK
jgi:hypothetical protein